MFGCDLMTGKPAWQVKARKWLGRGTAVGIVRDGAYYVRSGRGVLAYSIADGKTLWEVPSYTIGVGPIPTIADDVLYAGGPETLAIDTKTGKKLWGYRTMRLTDKHNQRQEQGGGHSSPLVSGDFVYIGRDDGDLVALDRRTGKPAWRYDLGLPVKSSPVVSGNMLFVYGFDGNLYAFAGTK